MRARRLSTFGCALSLLLGCTATPVELATVGPEGLIAHWPLNEGNGSTVNDTSGNQHNGVLQGPAYDWVSGKFGGAVHFSGADLMTTVASFPPATSNYTVSAWVFIAASDLGPPIANLVSTELVGGGWALFATLSSGLGAQPSFDFEYATSSPNPSQQLVIATCNCLVTGQWVHLAAVRDDTAGTLTLYAGSAPPVTVPAPLPILPGSTTLNLGRSTRQEPGSAFPVTGSVDDVLIYDRPLGAQEIAALGQNSVPDQN